jgi:hypothetical protein
MFGQYAVCMAFTLVQHERIDSLDCLLEPVHVRLAVSRSVGHLTCCMLHERMASCCISCTTLCIAACHAPATPAGKLVLAAFCLRVDAVINDSA